MHHYMLQLQVQIGPCKFSSFCDKMLTFSENNTKILMNFRQNFPQRIKNGANIGPHGIAPRPVILWIEQGGKPKMHSLNFLCHNEPCKTPWDDFFLSSMQMCGIPSFTSNPLRATPARVILSEPPARRPAHWFISGTRPTITSKLCR